MIHLRRFLNRRLWSLALASFSILALLSISFWNSLDGHYVLKSNRNPMRGLLSNTRPERSIHKNEGWFVLPDNVTIHIGKSPNLHNYDYVVNSPNLCSSLRNDTNVSVLIFIASSVENFAQRQAIRDTWGLLSLQQALNFRVVFLLGRATVESLQTRVLDEVYRYGDLIQENFTDTFRNLGVKSVMGLKWASKFCSSVTYVMKTDDDIFIHVPNLLKVLNTTPRSGVLLCHANRVRKILRKQFMENIPVWYKKYQVTEEELPGIYFPKYCAGLGYVVSIDAAKALYQVSLVTPYFFIEDAYITGFCREKLGLPLMDNSGFTLKPPIAPQQGVCAFQTGRITSQEIKPQEFYELWKEINTQGFFCPLVLGYMPN